jgi:hypothetical protein
MQFFVMSSSKYILVTEHLPGAQNIKAYNLDKKVGAEIRVPNGSGVFIDKPPFNLNARIIMEKNLIGDVYGAGERLVTWLVNE